MIDGKNNLKGTDMSRMLPIFVDRLLDIAYTLLAYSTAMKFEIRLIIYIMQKKKYKLFYTDTTVSGEEIQNFYRTRFHVKFCFRDAKQFYEMRDSQARDANELESAFNAISSRQTWLKS